VSVLLYQTGEGGGETGDGPEKSSLTTRKRSSLPLSRFGNVPLSLYITCLNVFVFIIDMLWGRGLTNAGAMRSVEIVRGGWWRLITPMFLHGGLFHLLFNSRFLLRIGPSFAERMLGPVLFLSTYFVSGVGGAWLSHLRNVGGPAAIQKLFSILEFAARRSRSPYTPSVGASGAIFGLLGAVLVQLLRLKATRAGAGSEAGAFASDLIWVAVANFVFGWMDSGIDNYGHLGGLLSGMAMAFLFAPTSREYEQRQKILPELDRVLREFNRAHCEAFRRCLNTIVTPEEVDERTMQLSDSQQMCLLLYARLLYTTAGMNRGLLTRERIPPHVDFGFCACRDAQEESRLASKYRTLFENRPFMEIVKAYEERKLFALLDLVGIRGRDSDQAVVGSEHVGRPSDDARSLSDDDTFIAGLADVLGGPAIKGVWYLKSATRSLGSGGIDAFRMNLPRQVGVDYGFLNCEDQDDPEFFRFLARVYKEFFEKGGDPLTLHAAFLKDEIAQLLISTVKVPNSEQNSCKKLTARRSLGGSGEYKFEDLPERFGSP